MRKETIDPRIKKEINQEGFEENAAVLVGTKEEVERLRERMETDGYAKDLATYIRLHKEILVPAEEITEKWLKDSLKPSYFSYYYDNENGDLQYIDKQGNLVQVIIEQDKIDDLREKDESIMYSIPEKLKELGFSKEELAHPSGGFRHLAKCARDYYQNKLEEEKRKDEAEKEFDF